MDLNKELKKYELRHEQNVALDFIERVITKTNKKFVMLDLPPGVGKSLIALKSSLLYNKIHPDTKVDIITAGKLLQDQYSNEFKSIGNLKGKDNYFCERHETSCASGRDLCRLNKESKCDACPYDNARMNYLMSDVSLTNFHLYLINHIYGIDFFKERKNTAKLLIVDEAHLFDDTISTFFCVRTAESFIKKLSLKDEAILIREMNLIVSVEQYVAFLSKLCGIIQQIAMTTLKSDEVKNEKDASRVLEKLLNKKVGSISTPSEELLSTLNFIVNTFNKITVFFTEYKKDPNNWVFIREKNEKGDVQLVLEPIWTGSYLNEYIWSKYDHVVLMSGTILDKEVFSFVNGIDHENAYYLSMPSPFEAKNREIVYMPLGKMSYANKLNTFEEYKKWFPKLLNKYKDKKGIIHTNSFELMEWISEGIINNRIISHDSSNKDAVLQKHYDGKEPTVIVSPSVSTGVSFDDDKARFQIVAKVPYPSLASEKNKKRREQNNDWYSLATVQQLIQTFGRICRSNTDYGTTIITDSSFGDIIRYSERYLPNWIKDSISTYDVNKKK